MGAGSIFGLVVIGVLGLTVAGSLVWLITALLSGYEHRSTH